MNAVIRAIGVNDKMYKRNGQAVKRCIHFKTKDFQILIAKDFDDNITLHNTDGTSRDNDKTLDLLIYKQTTRP